MPKEGRSKEKILAVGYGVGLSWSSAVFDLDADTPLLHSIYDKTILESEQS